MNKTLDTSTLLLLALVMSNIDSHVQNNKSAPEMMLHLASNLKRKNELDHKRRGHLHVLMPSKAGSLNGYGLMISVSDDVIGIGN